MKCPRCGSTHISQREFGMRSCATIGGLVGAAVGINSVLRGARLGVTIGAAGGPVGLIAGGLSGAILAGLCSGSAGCAIGSLAGNFLDAILFDNRECMHCGFTFRQGSHAAAVNVSMTPVHSPDAMPSPPPMSSSHPGEGMGPGMAFQD